MYLIQQLAKKIGAFSEIPECVNMVLSKVPTTSPANSAKPLQEVKYTSLGSLGKMTVTDKLSFLSSSSSSGASSEIIQDASADSVLTPATVNSAPSTRKRTSSALSNSGFTATFKVVTLVMHGNEMYYRTNEKCILNCLKELAAGEGR